MDNELPIRPVLEQDLEYLFEFGQYMEHKIGEEYFPMQTVYLSLDGQRALLTQEIHPISVNETNITVNIDHDYVHGQMIFKKPWVEGHFKSWDENPFVQNMHWMSYFYTPTKDYFHLVFHYQDRNFDLRPLAFTDSYRKSLRAINLLFKIKVFRNKLSFSVCNNIQEVYKELIDDVKGINQFNTKDKKKNTVKTKGMKSLSTEVSQSQILLLREILTPIRLYLPIWPAFLMD